ncbi:MAG: C4-type zinc ribbon domain-containing protein, partial [Verrucomicrobiota bacterium]
RLQSLEFGETKEKNAAAAIAELRGKIPPQIIAHYDRLLARGKKGVAAVRNQVCTGCHMRVPIGVVATLMHDTDIQICESCGRYLYLVDSTGTTAPAETAKPKPARKARSPKKSPLPVSTPDPTMSLAIDELGRSKMRPGLRSNPN